MFLENSPQGTDNNYNEITVMRKQIWLLNVVFMNTIVLYQSRFMFFAGDYVLKVICDDISTIFVDGVQKDVAGTGAWNQLATLSIPETTIAIGIQCQNTGGPYGIMAQVRKDYIQDFIEKFCGSFLITGCSVRSSATKLLSRASFPRLVLF